MLSCSAATDFSRVVYQSLTITVDISSVSSQDNWETAGLSHWEMWKIPRGRLGSCNLRGQAKRHTADKPTAGQFSDHQLESFSVLKLWFILVNFNHKLDLEFLFTLNFFSIGVPTSRAASLIVSDSKVHRDPLYSGNVIMEKCAVVMRVAPTFFRFGSFEIFKKRDPYSGMEGPSHGMQEKMMPTMLDFLIRNYYPEIFNKDSELENQT